MNNVDDRDWQALDGHGIGGFPNFVKHPDRFGPMMLWLASAFAAIRADERQQAAQRIAALEPTQDYGFMRVWRDEAINAARGYSDGNEFTRAAAAGRPYPNLVDNAAVRRKKAK